MEKLFNWLAWVVAVVVAILLALLQFGFAIKHDEQKRLTLFWVVVSILISIVSQLGLFLSPWATGWKNLYQKIVIVMMFPSILWLVSQLTTDFKEFLKGLKQASDGDFFGHGVEIIIIILILAIYFGQIVRVSRILRKKPQPNI